VSEESLSAPRSSVLIAALSTQTILDALLFFLEVGVEV
jgi:hypothetical protein